MGCDACGDGAVPGRVRLGLAFSRPVHCSRLPDAIVLPRGVSFTLALQRRHHWRPCGTGEDAAICGHHLSLLREEIGTPAPLCIGDGMAIEHEEPRKRKRAPGPQDREPADGVFRNRELPQGCRQHTRSAQPLQVFQPRQSIPAKPQRLQAPKARHVRGQPRRSFHPVDALHGQSGDGEQHLRILKHAPPRTHDLQTLPSATLPGERLLLAVFPGVGDWRVGTTARAGRTRQEAAEAGLVHGHDGEVSFLPAARLVTFLLRGHRVGSGRVAEALVAGARSRSRARRFGGDTTAGVTPELLLLLLLLLHRSIPHMRFVWPVPRRVRDDRSRALVISALPTVVRTTRVGRCHTRLFALPFRVGGARFRSMRTGFHVQVGERPLGVQGVIVQGARELANVEGLSGLPLRLGDALQVEVPEGGHIGHYVGPVVRRPDPRNRIAVESELHERLDAQEAGDVSEAPDAVVAQEHALELRQ
mmetsp:Transcript_15196/g.45700  ORF Transcript_15196/g.45700 Transcript_15196/m.45700 type:complete len:474 (-) Transcript_15196:1504-2925(-)